MARGGGGRGWWSVGPGAHQGADHARQAIEAATREGGAEESRDLEVLDGRRARAGAHLEQLALRVIAAVKYQHLVAGAHREGRAVRAARRRCSARAQPPKRYCVDARLDILVLHACGVWAGGRVAG